MAGWQVVVATHVNDRAADIEAAGFLLEPLPLARRGMNPWREIRTILALRAAIARQRPDILHAVAIKPILYGTLASRFGRACPVLGTLPGLGYAFTGDRAAVRLLRAGLTLALRVVYRWARLTLTVQNSDDRAVLDDHRIAPGPQVRMIAGGVGVDLDAWPACEPPDGPTVIFAIVARMLWDKGIGEAVEACRQLKQRGIDCRLWLVGVPDPQNPTSITESELTAWQDKQLVEWLGFRADIAAIWQQAHVALLPSYRKACRPR